MITRKQSKKDKTKKPTKKAAKKKAPACKSGAKPKAKKPCTVGRTIKTKDKHLPIPKGGKSANPKDKRWIAVIDLNEKNELAVVRLTTEKQPNTTKLPNYNKGNGKTTYFKHFVEIEDSNGNPIKIDGVRFVENPKKYDLTKSQVRQVQNRVLKHSAQAPENKKKIEILRGRKKKGK